MKIALLEDDLAVAKTIQEWLIEAGFKVDHFRTGLDFLRKFSHNHYDAYIFDWALPDMEGPDVMVSIKLRSTKLPPIIFLTGNTEASDIVRVIQSGADDYLLKPPSRALLLARINALIKRATTKTADTVYDFGALKVDTKLRQVFLESEEIKLKDKVFDLLACLLSNESLLLSHSHLTQIMWGSNAEMEGQSVEEEVNDLCAKLKLTAAFSWKLTSIHQQAYRLERSE